MTNSASSSDIEESPSRGAIRHIAVVDVLASSSGPLSLSETAQALNVPRPTAHRLLNALVREGWVLASGNPKRYVLSWKVTELGFKAAQASRVREVVLDAAIDLARTIGYQVVLLFYERGDAILTDSVEIRSERILPRVIGLRWPAAATAAGRVLLAYQSNDDIELALTKEWPGQSAPDAPTREEIRASLSQIRERGYHAGYNFNGHGGLAVPVFDAPGRIASSLGVAIPGELAEDVVSEVLRPTLAAAQHASHDLGYRAVRFM